MPPIEKILLIYPPSTQAIGAPRTCAHPLGIAYLGAVLKKDYEVKLLDATTENHRNIKNLGNGLIKYGLSDEEIKNIIAEYSPNVLGITCLYSSQFPFVRKICQISKEINQDTLTIVGGTHPTFLPEESLVEESMDFIVLGEGEDTIQKLLKKIRTGQDIFDLNGIAFRKNGQVKINPRIGHIENLDELPFPSWELLPMDKYSKINLSMSTTSRSRYWAPIITSRGCPAKCLFCSSVHFWGNQYRARAARNVLDEIELLAKEYKIKEIQF